MRLVSLYARNFKKLKLDEPISFPEGITLISGLNESGKSTILDAILYALFGRVVRPRMVPRNEDILAYGTDKATVTLRFSIDKRTFAVRREVFRSSPNKAALREILPGRQARPIADGYRPVTQEIEKLLGGITYNEIVASNVVAQKDLNHLIEQSKQERKRVVNIFLNLESFNNVLDKLNEERKNLEGTHARPGHITVEEKNLDQLEKELDLYNQSCKELKKRQEEVKALTGDLETLRENQRATESLYANLLKYEEALTEKNNLITQLKLKQELQKNINTQLKDLKTKEQQLKNTKEGLKAYEDLDQAEAALSPIEGNLQKLTNLTAKQRATTERRDDICAKIRDIEEKKPKGPEAEHDLQELRQLQSRKPRTRTYILLGGALILGALATYVTLANLALSTLLGALGAFLFALAGRETSKMTRLTKLQQIYQASLSGQMALTSFKTDLSRTEQEVETLQKQMSETEAKLLHICASIQRYSQLYENMKSQTPAEISRALVTRLQEEKQKRRSLQERVSALSEDLGARPELERRAVSEEAAVKSLQEKGAAIIFPELPEGAAFSRDLLRTTGEKRDELNAVISRKATLLEGTRSRIEEISTYIEQHKDIEGKTEEQRQKVEDLRHRLNVTKLAINGLEKTTEALRDRVRPSVENYMGIILPTITSGRYKAVQLDEQYNLQAYDPEAGEFKSKEVFSGGTEDQLLLSMRLAFALALLPEVKGRHPEFLFLDEPLGSSDEIRRSGIIDLLRSDLSKNFRQIFLISHVGGLDSEFQTAIRLDEGRVVERSTTTLIDRT
ncbi:MAG: AAA family ATPase [Nitrososphaeria archaeon]